MFRTSLILLFLAGSLQAAPKVQPGGIVNLPYMWPDGKTPCWIVQNGGWIQQRRLNADEGIYAQAAMLNIDQNNPNQTNNQARVDSKTGEVILENFQPVNGLQFSRRVQARRDEDLLRCIDIFKNVGPADVTINLQYTTSLNRGVTMAQTMQDQKKAGADMAWVAQTQRGKTAVEIFAGKGAQQFGQMQWEQGNNAVQYNMQLEVPAGKSVAVMHLHAITTSPDKGGELVNSLKPSKLVNDLPPDLRKAIVNFPVNRNYVGDREILRGSLFDVVELRGGDCLYGTLQEKSYKLQTLFGPMELPADKVVGLLNAGQFRPRQLLISTDGEMIGGALAKQTIDLQLGSGQMTQVPLSQISRVGYRKRADEPDDWKFDKPMVILQSGDRMNIELPEQPIDVVTRYGTLKLDPTNIASLVLQGEEHGVHEILLANGSKFAGLASAEQISMKLASTGQSITLPMSSIARLQFINEAADIPEDAATLSLSSGDVLIGALAGELKLDTMFDTIKLPTSQVRGLTRIKDSNSDVQITLWDQTKLSGQLEEPALVCDVGGGISMKIPVPLIDSYLQPSPMPSDAMLDKIKKTVDQLSADDWKVRDQAQADLVAMGQTVVPVIKKLRAQQGPEAQQRIDAILKQFEKPSAGATPRPIDQ